MTSKVKRLRKFIKYSVLKEGNKCLLFRVHSEDGLLVLYM